MNDETQGSRRARRSTRNLLSFWLACLAVFLVAWSWRPQELPTTAGGPAAGEAPAGSVGSPPSGAQAERATLVEPASHTDSAAQTAAARTDARQAGTAQAGAARAGTASSDRPACATAGSPPPSSSNRLLSRLFLDNEDSWLAMRAGLERIPHAADEPLYAGIFAQCIKFQYPPSSLLLLDFASALFGPRVLQNAVLNGVSLLMLGLMLGAVWKIYTHLLPAGWGSWGQHAVPLLFTVTCYPVLKAVELGQIQTWLNALFAVAVLLYCKDRRLAAGVLLGLIATIKPQLALVLPWALLRRDWALAKGMAGCAAVIMTTSVLRYGLAPHLEYVGVVSALSRHGESYYANHSFNGLLLRALQLGTNVTFEADRFAPYHPLVHAGTTLSTLALVAFALLSRRASHRELPALNLVLAGLCFTMASPIAWEHHYGLVPVVFAVLVPLLLARKDVAPALWAALGLSWILIAARFSATLALHDTGWNFLQSHVYFGALLLLGVLHLARREVGAPPPEPAGVLVR